MADQELQTQITELNRKIDLLLEGIEAQNRKREEFDDLVEDVSIVAKDAFRQTVTLLDKSQVELDNCGISCLMIKILQNLDTFHDMLEMMESARDFMKDATPILHQVGLDAVNKMNELDQKGYFVFGRELMEIMDRFVQTFTVEDMQRLRESMVHFTGIIRNLSDPGFVSGLENVTRAITKVKMDDKVDDVSLWKIFMMMRSPEVRKSLSYSLRLISEISR